MHRSVVVKQAVKHATGAGNDLSEGRPTCAGMLVINIFERICSVVKSFGEDCILMYELGYLRDEATNITKSASACSSGSSCIEEFPSAS
jgi:hypothetical protein